MPGAAPVGDSNKKAGEHPGAPHFQSRFSLPEGPTGTRTTATQQSQCGPRVRQSSYGEYMMYRASMATPAAGGSRNPRRRQSSLDHSVQRIQQSFIEPADQDMMGPLLRRKKVLSVPIGGAARAEDDFFAPAAPPSPGGGRAVSMAVPYHRDLSISPGAGGAAPLVRKRRNRNSLSLGSLITRKQVSMDLYAPEAAEFFEGEEEEEVLPLAPTLEGEGEEVPGQEPPTREEQQEHEKQVKLFKPLRFSPPAKLAGAAVDHREFDPGAPSVLKEQDDAVRQAFDQQQKHHQQLKRQIDMLTDHLEGINDPEQEKLMEDIQTTRDNVESDTLELKNKLFGEEFDLPQEEVDAIEEAARRASGEHVQQTFGTEVKVDAFVDDFDETGIIRARKKDYTWTGILLCVMIAFTGVVVGWETHLDETYSTFGVVGLACATPCEGSLESQDYFNGHSQFEEGQFIQLTMQIDPTPIPHTSAIVEIVGVETNHTKKTLEFGPVGDEVPETWVEKFEVDFDHPHEDHIINVHSSNSTVRLTYKLHAATLSHLAKHSELIAALIMIFVYIFILLEVIHRTLVAIFGSLVALLFFFLIHHGESESITAVMLHLEWSTLGLLFGMMLIVGELSHTGIFEWLAVRLLVASKGSNNRLMILLCLLTAVASAFLDNVTTMLLVAPVTIDMCSILNVDPRPYLIGEVILSNVGGTATLIGDPPNIIIGSAFEEIGFVDFIINVLPCIFLICIPVSVGLILYMYRYYMNSTKMLELDKPKLMRTYQIYDEPRLLIAGTVAFFVILIFFLHPVHHKDTAWIALLGAFITMTFTNPHDVQDALRNHVEWDTLLFFAGLFVLVEVCAAMGLLAAIGNALAKYIEAQEEEKQLTVAITLILWVSAITSAFLDNIPYTATMIPVIRILADELPETLPIETLAWALSFGACLGGNGTLLGASANIVTAGISTNKGFDISFLNFLYPGFVTMVFTVAVANIYMLIVYVWI